MIVVSDTTPLITLMKASRLELLEKLFGTVHIPKAVFDELTCNAAFAEEADLIRSSPFIQVVAVRDPSRVDLYCAARQGWTGVRARRSSMRTTSEPICC